VKFGGRGGRSLVDWCLLLVSQCALGGSLDQVSYCYLLLLLEDVAHLVVLVVGRVFVVKGLRKGKGSTPIWTEFNQ
jgi:hypothetical protein